MARMVRIPYARRAPARPGPSRREALGGLGAVGIALLLDGPLTGCVTDEPAPDPPDPGRLAVDGPLSIAAGEEATWIYTVTVGEAGLVVGDRLALAVEHGTDWGSEWGDDGMPVHRLGGITVAAAGAATFEVHEGGLISAGNAVEIELVEGALDPDERVSITVGDAGAGGLLRAPTMAHAAALRVLEHLGGEQTDDDFRLYREVGPAPAIEVLPRAPAAVSVLARSHAAPGQPVALVLRVEDELGNAEPTFAGEVTVLDDEADEVLWSGAFADAEGGVLRIEDLTFPAAGTRRLRVEIPDLGRTEYGGPVEVTDDPGFEAVRWGQTHGHTLVSDGLGSAEEWHEYARDRSNLDFVALTDHGFLTEQVTDFQFFRHHIDAEAWAALAEVVRAFHEPGRFVTFLAYEWTSNQYSDKNVYFLHDTEPWQDYPTTLQGLYERYAARADEVTIVSHMMWATPFHRATDWETFDGELERVVEVASVHGVREYAGNPYWPDDDRWAQERAEEMRGHLVADGLAAGHHLGLVCGADCHQGFPGNRHRGRHPCRCDGMMAVRSAELSRDAIWTRWRDRGVYGTTGPRVLLDVTLGGARMGQTVALPGDAPRTLTIRVAAPVPVLRVEIVRDDPEQPVEVVDLDPPTWNPDPLEWTDTTPLEAEAFYYVRVFLEGDDFAWSSPIWVEPT